MLDHLAKIAECDPAVLSEQIFSVGSPLLTLNPEQAINADCKAYAEAGQRFTVAQVEELTFSHFPEKRAALLDALEAHRQREGLLFASLLVTDINGQTSLLLVRGDERFLKTIDYPEYGPFIWELAAVVSGHSHRPTAEVRGGVLFLNPGSAGPRRFSLPLTIAKLRVIGKSLSHEFIELAV